jgi:orotate phosphoribosyltransferase
MSAKNAAAEAARLGMIKFAPPSRPFPGRHSGESHDFLIDTRGAGTNIPLRMLIIDVLRLRLAEFAGTEVVAGVAKSGITWGSWLAWELGVEYATVVGTPRASGMKRAVEGDVAGKRLVIIDNFTLSGESIEKAARLAESAGAQVCGALVVVKHPRASSRLPLLPAWDLLDLLDASVEAGLIDARTKQRIWEKENL